MPVARTEGCTGSWNRLRNVIEDVTSPEDGKHADIAVSNRFIRLWPR